MIALPPILQVKPTFSSPCNGCGFCCHSEVCELGKIAIPEAVEPCPLLEFETGRFWCGLVLKETQHGMTPLIAQTLAIGRGCDAEFVRDEQEEA